MWHYFAIDYDFFFLLSTGSLKTEIDSSKHSNPRQTRFPEISSQVVPLPRGHSGRQIRRKVGLSRGVRQRQVIGGHYYMQEFESSRNTHGGTIRRLFEVTGVCAWLTLETGVQLNVQNDHEGHYLFCLLEPQVRLCLVFLTLFCTHREKGKEGGRERERQRLGETERERRLTRHVYFCLESPLY